MKEKVILWMEGFAASPHAPWWLFAIAFVESSIFPIPPDVVLIAMGLENPDKALLYGAICSVGSVLGGMLGYAIGLFGGRPVLYKLFNENKIHAVEKLYDKYNAWATGIAGLTPIPYKIFTIGGGAFKIDFKVFLLASVASRSFRFMLEGFLLWQFGDAIRETLVSSLNLISVAFVVLLVAGFWLVGRFGAKTGKAIEDGAE